MEKELGELVSAGVNVTGDLGGLQTAPGPFANVVKNVGLSTDAVYRATHVRTPTAAGGGRAAVGLIGTQLGTGAAAR